MLAWRHRIAPFSIALIAMGCQVYDPSLLDRDAQPARDAPDSGTGGMCEGRRPPPRPTTADGPDVPDVAFALRMVVLDQADEWRNIGYNLDGLCTRGPDYASECEPTDARPQVDGNDGIDNVFGDRLFPLVSAVVMNLEATARASQEMGLGLPVLRVRGWNGMPNDPRIVVAITSAVDTVSVTPPSDTAPAVTFDENFEAHFAADGTQAPPPQWDGNDWAYVRDDTFLGGMLDTPLVYDDNAYVADDVIVVTLPSRVEILFPTTMVGVVVRLTGAVATGHLSADRMTLENSVVAGRWSIVDLLRTAENIGVCMGTGEYNVLEASLHQIADVRAEPGTGGAGVPCDAISLGVGFTGTRLRIGGVAAGRGLNSLCAAAGLDGGMPDGG